MIDRPRSYRAPRWKASVVVAAALVFAAGCGADDDDAADAPATTPPPATEPVGGTEADAELPVAHDAWVRMPASGQTVAAGYVTFVNGGDTDLQLAAVRSDLADAELHETVADDAGVMRMQERTEGFVVPANGELVLAPGGAHVMLLGVDPLDLAVLDEVELVFEFVDVGELTVTAELRRDTAMSGNGDDDETDHDANHDTNHDTDHDAGHGTDEMDHGDMTDVTEMTELDADALHALDDELHAGVLEPERQRTLVAESIAALDAMADAGEVPDGVDAVRLRAALGELDAALESGDLEAATTLAFEVHDLTHALVPHQH